MNRELDLQLQLIKKESQASARVHSFRMWEKLHPKQQDVCQFSTTYGCLLGGNQTGKSTTSILRTRFHSSGEYPETWTGDRTFRGQDLWFAGDRWSTLRDSIQTKMFGKDLQHPGRVVDGQDPPYFTEDLIVPNSWRTAPNGGGALESIQIKHVPSGGVSNLTFKTYHMGMDGLASATIDGICVDEECDFKIIQELTMRIIVRNGWIMGSFTPLRGRSRYYKFWERMDTKYGTVRWVSQDEVQHLNPTLLAAIRESYKGDAGQLQARIKGEPVLASGLVFPFRTEDIWIDHFPIPKDWPVIAGMDIGVGTPTVIMPKAIDPNTGDKYIYACYAVAGQNARTHHYAAMDAFGDVNISMDLAANQRDKASAETVLDVYNKLTHGENYRREIPQAMWKYRTVPNRSWSVGFELMSEEIRDGKLYVLKDPPGVSNYRFSTNEFRDEFEEAEWDSDGVAIKDRNKFHRLDGWRYGTVGESMARVPGHRRMISRGQQMPVVRDWAPTPGNLRS